MVQELILIRGLPGSGKSTLAKKLQELNHYTHGLPWYHFETDEFFTNAAGVYTFVPEMLHKAHAWTQENVRAVLKVGANCIVSNTFSRIWEMQPYLDMAKEFGAKVTVLTCEGNHSEAGVSTKGANGNVHGVPEETINKMKARWERYGV